MEKIEKELTDLTSYMVVAGVKTKSGSRSCSLSFSLNIVCDGYQQTGLYVLDVRKKYAERILKHALDNVVLTVDGQVYTEIISGSIIFNQDIVGHFLRRIEKMTLDTYRFKTTRI